MDRASLATSTATTKLLSRQKHFKSAKVCPGFQLPRNAFEWQLAEAKKVDKALKK